MVGVNLNLSIQMPCPLTNPHQAKTRSFDSTILFRHKAYTVIGDSHTQPVRFVSQAYQYPGSTCMACHVGQCLLCDAIQIRYQIRLERPALFNIKFNCVIKLFQQVHGR